MWKVVLEGKVRRLDLGIDGKGSIVRVNTPETGPLVDGETHELKEKSDVR